MLRLNWQDLLIIERHIRSLIEENILKFLGNIRVLEVYLVLSFNYGIWILRE